MRASHRTSCFFKNANLFHILSQLSLCLNTYDSQPRQRTRFKWIVSRVVADQAVRLGLDNNQNLAQNTRVTKPRIGGFSSLKTASKGTLSMIADLALQSLKICVVRFRKVSIRGHETPHLRFLGQIMEAWVLIIAGGIARPQFVQDDPRRSLVRFRWRRTPLA